MIGRPVGWKASDEAFTVWLAGLQESRMRRSNLARFERPELPPWAVAYRGYAERTEQYRRMLHQQRATTNERKSA